MSLKLKTIQITVNGQKIIINEADKHKYQKPVEKKETPAEKQISIEDDQPKKRGRKPKAE